VDRRDELDTAPVPAAVALLAGAALAVVVASALLVGRALDPVAAARAGALLTAAAAAGALTTAGLALARWTTSGEAPSLWIGAALLAAGIALAGAAMLPGGGAAGAAGAGGAGGAAVVVVVAAGLAVGCGVVAALAPAVDTRLRVLPVVAAVAVAPVAAGALAVPVGPGGAGAALLLAAGAAAAAALLLRRAVVDGHPLAAGAGVLAAASAAAALAGLSAGPGARLVTGAAHVAGLGAVAAGAARQLQLGYRTQRTHLFRARASLRSAQDRLRAQEERDEERAHEARSALAAIDGATQTLERYHDRLPPGTRSQLAAAVQGEIQRLQRLIAVTDDEVVRVDLNELVDPLVVAERARGTVVHRDVPAGLVAAARSGATADAVRALLDNARVHARGSEVTLRAEAAGHRVLLRVEDRGPGVPAELRRTVFRRGARGEDRGAAGRGLGLAIAEELARGQGGQLWVEERPGGGASFVLSLPAWSWDAAAGVEAARREAAGRTAS